jgi:hypothetical protein
VLVFDLGASPEATVQCVRATEAIELILERCLRLHLDESLVDFSHAGASMLPSNMVHVKPSLSVSSIAGGCYESSCDTLLQPLVLAGFGQGVAAQHPLEVVCHLVVDVYHLSMVFARQCELL